ncbi:MAG TPA: phosphoribosylanthranilate isomerase [Pirellulales bacterium]|jgi:phosphoribosylanthranilate isomerase|nr:phosphoribosylanthranilate isomerase [Pirellulales bacterium]
MFRIKICGVTTAADARGAAHAGADAIGLNFYPGSRRYLPPAAAKEVAAAIPQGVRKVGVFVNAEPDFVCREADRLRLDLIQLAGDETPEYLSKLGGRPVMQAFRPRLDHADALRTIVRFVEAAARLTCAPKLTLIDAHRPGEYGGTGEAVNWTLLSRLWNELDGAAPRLVLAGGLSPENVADAIAAVRPAAVDVASGVESSPGVKDSEQVRRFVAAANAAFRINESRVSPQR